MIFSQEFAQSNNWTKIENPQTNKEKGLWGEQIVSELLISLHIPHKHHDFTSIEKYYSTSTHGSDIWDCGFFQIEVKYYPNSWLNEDTYSNKVKPRFDPSAKLKICVVIEGYISKDVVSLFEKDNIILIWIWDKSLIPKLKSLLNYYFIVNGYWNRGIIYRPCSNTLAPSFDIPFDVSNIESILVDLVILFGEPPPEIGFLAMNSTQS
jgi:hypothetical protein